ncbi:hypothetical protein PQD71_gp110 [Kosakonia phage Kc263]|uniref:Uncharacterized protein n=1 Tax=Kosakonia phage Kc263 TaxID=2863194 RepID=A0AAE8BFH0_9CAUD|nr:hypothetical protein PQD71_gp110 [Kosakonia phage Kc263]QYN80003.1 hypothetical protein [Kosakonia phage Kc263]
MSEEQKDPQPDLTNALRDMVLGSGTSDEVAILPMFLGTAEEVHKVIYRTAVSYMAWQQAQEAADKGKETRDVNALKLNFDTLADEHFKGMDYDELIPMLINYTRFLYAYTDRHLMRSDNVSLVERTGWVNTVPAKGDLRLGLIQSVTPKPDSKLDVRSRMRRNFRAAVHAPDSFTIVLLNSLIVLRVKIPTPSDLIRLINDVSTKLRQYGERYNVTSIHLERAGISQILVNFILDRLSYHSVKDVADHYELKRYIKVNDLEHIAMALLAISAPKGVAYRTYCLANECKHSEVIIIDPASMVLTLENAMPEERRNILFEITSNGRKLSREELAKYAPVYVDENGEPLDLTCDLGNTGSRIVLGVPSLEEYFRCYEMMAERINPELRELAIQFPNMDVFRTKRREYLASLRGHEYMHWFRLYEELPEPGTEDTEIKTITREEDPEGFSEGLIDIFNEDEEVYFSALEKVITLAPRMTYTFVGIMNNVCPACKKENDSVSASRLSGFTPVDPILNFLDRTRMMIGIRTEAASTVEETLS